MVHRNQRQLDDEQLQQVELMFKQNKSKPAEIQQLINKKFNLNLQLSDINNLKQKFKSDFNYDLTDIQNVDQLIQERIKIDGHNGFQIAYNKENDKLNIELLFYQNNEMRKNYKEYGQLVFLGIDFIIFFI